MKQLKCAYLMGAILDKILKSEGIIPAAPDKAGDDDKNKDNIPPKLDDANTDVDDIDDEKLLNALKKRGLEHINTIDDLKPKAAEPTEDEKREADRKKQDNIRAYGLQNGKVTSAELDSYAIDLALPEDQLAFKVYRAERLAELKDVPEDERPSDADIENDFKEEFHLNGSDKDPKRQRAQKILKSMADAYLKHTYKGVRSLEGEYNSHEQDAQRRTKYNGVVDAAFAAVPETIEFDIKNSKTNQTEKYPFKVTPEILKKVKETYIGDAMFKLLGQTNVDKDKLVAAVIGSIRESEFLNILSEVSNAHLDKNFKEIKKGRRAIPAETGGLQLSNEPGEKKRNPAVVKILNKKENQQILKRK